MWGGSFQCHLQRSSFSGHTHGRTAVVHSVGSVEAVCSLLTAAGVKSPHAAVCTQITSYSAFIHVSQNQIRKKELSLHEAVHMVSLTCCCVPDCFFCPGAAAGFVDFVHSCVSAASSTPPSIAPPLTPPAADGHAQKAPPPGAAPPLHCCLH